MKTKPNIGDIVVIINPALGNKYGKKYVVTGYMTEGNEHNCVWLAAGENGGRDFWIYITSCELAKTDGKTT